MSRLDISFLSKIRGLLLGAAAIFAAAVFLAACGRETASAPAAENSVANPEEAREAAALYADAVNAQSVRDVKRLQHAFAHYAEAGDWRAMASLFSPDGKYVSGDAEIAGVEALYAHFRDDMGAGENGLAADRLNVRLFLSPVVTLAADGKSAKGRWHEVAMLGQYGEKAFWKGGVYENDYVLKDGVWKIAMLHYYPQYAGPYERGWRNVADVVPLTPYHYTPEEAGKPAPNAPLVADYDAGQADSLARKAGAIATALIEEGEVQNLQAAYGYYVDRKMWDDVADLFTENATYDVAGEGLYRGREAIRARFMSLGEIGLAEGEVNDHLQLDPVVSLAPDGETATIRGFELQMTGVHGGASAWAFGIFENGYVKEDDVWKIRSVKIWPRFAADYDIGWGRDLLTPARTVDAQHAASTLVSADYPQHGSPAVSFPGTVDRAAAHKEAPRSHEEIARRVAVAKAFDGAENVSNAYGYYIDEFRWDDTADLFSEDGWKELSYIGNYIGRERVRGSLFSRYGDAGRRPGFMAIHQKTQPYVTVAPNGKSAQIRLRLFQFNSQLDGDGSYISGIYENQAKLENGVWKIAGMDLDYVFLANYTGGWAAVEEGSAERFAPTPESIAKYPPDGPLRGVTFAPFPAIAPMGFHFDNPVSGRTPALKLQWSISSRPDGEVADAPTDSE